MTDFLLIVGLLLTLLSLPLLMASYAQSTRPFRGAFLLVLGGGMIAAAMVLVPQPYKLSEIPYVALSVLAQVLP